MQLYMYLKKKKPVGVIAGSTNTVLILIDSPQIAVPQAVTSFLPRCTYEKDYFLNTLHHGVIQLFIAWGQNRICQL